MQDHIEGIEGMHEESAESADTKAGGEEKTDPDPQHKGVYECIFGCKFSGAYDDVLKHEGSCPLAKSGSSFGPKSRVAQMNRAASAAGVMSKFKKKMAKAPKRVEGLLTEA